MTVPSDYTLLGAAPERLPCIAIGSVVSQSSNGSMLLAYRRGVVEMGGGWVSASEEKFLSAQVGTPAQPFGPATFATFITKEL